MLMVNSFCVVRPAASVSVTVKRNAPAEVGVPARAPLGASSVSPGGAVPADRVKTYGGVPPAPAMVVAYATPVAPSGKAAGDVRVRAPATVRVKSLEAREEFASTTW